jgi:molybdopterin-guanine dinucleotide biosynthesis protein A
MNKMQQKDLWGLVLTGGRSTRMKKDKAQLEYNGEPQARRAFALLSLFCPKVFVSTREESAQLSYQKDLPKIYDREEYIDAGPLAGILSAMQEHPQAAWLVLACDLPLADEAALKNLITNRNPQKYATGYISTHDGLPEPLCAIYEPHYRTRLEEFFKKGTACPRKVMINSDVELIEQKDPRWLDNVNTPEEYREIAQKLKKR